MGPLDPSGAPEPEPWGHRALILIKDPSYRNPMFSDHDKIKGPIPERFLIYASIDATAAYLSVVGLCCKMNIPLESLATTIGEPGVLHSIAFDEIQKKFVQIADRPFADDSIKDLPSESIDILGDVRTAVPEIRRLVAELHKDILIYRALKKSCSASLRTTEIKGKSIRHVCFLLPLTRRVLPPISMTTATMPTKTAFRHLPRVQKSPPHNASPLLLRSPTSHYTWTTRPVGESPF